MRLGLGLALLTCILGCRDEPSSGRAFKLGFTTGAQEFIIHTMASHGFFEKNQLDPEMVETLSPASLHLMVVERQVDIAFAGITSMAVARARGKRVLVAEGVLTPVNAIFVRHDSSLGDLAELRGKKLGLFGGPGSTTFAFLAVIARRWFDLDLGEDVEIVTAAPAMLVSLLERGEIDAALMGSNESLKLRASKDYRVLFDLGDELKEREGASLAHVGVAIHEDFAATRADMLQRFLKAYRETAAYLREHPELWTEYGHRIGMGSDDEVEVIRSKMTASLVTAWGASERARQLEYLALARETLGDAVIANVPVDLFWDSEGSGR